jgi:hypothetical protein
MPEEPEVETERLHEAIHEELEREGSALLRRIALTTAVFAALAAVAALEAGDTVNEALVLKTEAGRLQAQASDQWAYYQAKGIKAAVRAAEASSWTAVGKTAPPTLAADQQRYAAEQADIQREARSLEQERDAKSREADELVGKHHRFASAVALFQVAIALGAMAALTRMRLLWFGSMLLGLAGAVLFAMPWLG